MIPEFLEFSKCLVLLYEKPSILQRHQTSADKDTKCPDTSVSSLSGKLGLNLDSGKNRDRQNLDKMTWDSIFHKISDWNSRIKNSDYPDSGQNRDRQVPDRSGQKRDKNRTRTEQSIDVWSTLWFSIKIGFVDIFQKALLVLSWKQWCGVANHPQNWGKDVRLNSLTSVNHGLITFWCLVVFRSCLQTSENSIMNIRFIERTWTNIG